MYKLISNAWTNIDDICCISNSYYSLVHAHNSLTLLPCWLCRSNSIRINLQSVKVLNNLQLVSMGLNKRCCIDYCSNFSTTNLLLINLYALKFLKSTICKLENSIRNPSLRTTSVVRQGSSLSRYLDS